MDGAKGLPGVTYGLPESIPQSGKKCATGAGLDWRTIDTCAKGAQGAQLLHDSHFHTMALFDGPSPDVVGGGGHPGRAYGTHPSPGVPGLGHGYRPPLIPNIWVRDHLAAQY